MNTAIAIFVKTPSLSPVKTRLAAGVGGAAALEFYRFSLEAVKETVRLAKASPYWAVAEEEGCADPLWRDFPAHHTGEGCLGARQHAVYQDLLARHDRVLLIGADAPQISKDLLAQAARALDTHDFVIGSARDGGYYLFGGRISTERDIWTSVPWSTNVTRERLEAALPSKPVHLPLLTDVDTKDDLRYLRQEMPEHMSDKQKDLLEWMKAHEYPVSLHG